MEIKIVTEKISKRTSLFLMANLGAEVSRILSAKKNNDFILVKSALERASTILTQLYAVDDMQKRKEEIIILDEVIRDTAQEHSILHVSPAHLQSYFIPFATRLMSI